jgi:hypothetical protein
MFNVNCLVSKRTESEKMLPLVFSSCGKCMRLVQKQRSPHSSQVLCVQMGAHIYKLLFMHLRGNSASRCGTSFHDLSVVTVPGPAKIKPQTESSLWTTG